MALTQWHHQQQQTFGNCRERPLLLHHPYFQLSNFPNSLKFSQPPYLVSLLQMKKQIIFLMLKSQPADLLINLSGAEHR